jgi:hypothetical protein
MKQAAGRACYVLDAGFFFGLFFYHKDGSIMLLRNVG